MSIEFIVLVLLFGIFVCIEGFFGFKNFKQRITEYKKSQEMNELWRMRDEREIKPKSHNEHVVDIALNIFIRDQNMSIEQCFSCAESFYTKAKSFIKDNKEVLK